MMESVLRWVDSSRVSAPAAGVDWLRMTPFIGLHVAALCVVFVGWSPVAVGVAVASYLVRMFAITAFYHRYFAHKSFRVGRVVQFLFAALGATATQRGPLWWAAHHRRHHRHADTDADPHCSRKGFLWSHMGWFLSGRNFVSGYDGVRDWASFPELRWLDRFDTAMPAALGVLMFGLGELLAAVDPGLGTSGWQMLVWGYFLSTVVLVHVTLCVNSVCHRFGRRRFDTDDDSRNNLLLALLTLGEGWHNNHHRYAGSARQGFYWWEIDVSYWLLRLLEKLGIVRDLRPVPPAILEAGRS